MKKLVNEQECNNETIVIFKIGRGGRFYNGGHLEFKGIGNINDYTEDLFLSDENEDEDTEWIACNGRKVGLKFINDGTGWIDIDGDYDTTYACRVSELNDNEVDTIINSDYCCRDSVLVEYANSLEFSDVAIKLMKYFNDWDYLTEYYLPDNIVTYVDNYYTMYDDEDNIPEGVDYLEVDGKFYTK